MLPAFGCPGHVGTATSGGSTASTTVYTIAPRVFPLYVFKQVALSITHGNAPQSPYSYAQYGLILCGVLGDLDAGYQWGQLGLRLIDRP